MTVKNSENTQFRSGEEAAKRGANGGKASGKARREKKAMRETLETLLSMPLETGKAANIEKIKSIAALKGKNITVQEAILLKQLEKAIKGDTRAAEFIRDSSGNKAKEEISLSGEVNNPLAGLSTEELKRLLTND